MAVATGLGTVTATGQTARPPSENVTVTGTRSRDVLQGFVGSLATPTRLTGKMARWASGICPVTVEDPEFVKFINRRLKEVALSGRAGQRQRVVQAQYRDRVRTTPQDLVVDLRKRSRSTGLLCRQGEQRRSTRHCHPPGPSVWYTTATQDVQGGLLFDNAKARGFDQPEGVSLRPRYFPPAARSKTLSAAGGFHHGLAPGRRAAQRIL